MLDALQPWTLGSPPADAVHQGLQSALGLNVAGVGSGGGDPGACRLGALWAPQQLPRRVGLTLRPAVSADGLARGLHRRQRLGQGGAGGRCRRGRLDVRFRDGS